MALVAGTAVECSLHVCYVDELGNLLHALRGAEGGWTRFDRVSAAANNADDNLFLSCAGVANDLHVMAVKRSDGELHHATRRTDGSWDGFHPMGRQDIRQLASAGIGAQLHVCAVRGNDHRFVHGLRNADGTWNALDLPASASATGVQRMACANVLGELHVVAIRDDGHLHHAIRRDDGTWSGFSRVTGRFDTPGPLERIACAGDFFRLHVFATTSDGALFHAMRTHHPAGDPTWEGFHRAPIEPPRDPSRTPSIAAASLLPMSPDILLCLTQVHGLVDLVTRRLDGSWSGSLPPSDSPPSLHREHAEAPPDLLEWGIRPILV